jgi:hypothetical protein
MINIFVDSPTEFGLFKSSVYKGRSGLIVLSEKCSLLTLLFMRILLRKNSEVTLCLRVVSSFHIFFDSSFLVFLPFAAL